MKHKLNWKQRAAALSAFTLIAASQASAAIPADLTDAVDDAKTDALAALAAGGLAIIGIAVAALAYRVVQKLIKRAAGAI